MKAASLLSWGNYPLIPQVPTACYWRSDLADQFSKVRSASGTTLAYGGGMSYGDSCLAASDHVIHLLSLDRFISVDWVTGVIAAEAGITLEKILAIAIPHGWFLSVTPGTKFATLGGAIANDVHGKNHHQRGTFGRHVRKIGLLRSDVGHQICSPDERSELFNATIGGLGLTGLIDWAEIQLVPIRSSQINSVTQRFHDLDGFLELTAASERSHEFSVSWMDCTARPNAIGRGVMISGDFASDGGLIVKCPRTSFLPMTPAVCLVNGLVSVAFNEVHWRKSSRSPKHAQVGYNSFFYPLDAILKWNRIYGRAGLQQYHCVIPDLEARYVIRELFAAIVDSGIGSPLAVIKRFGNMSSPGLLSFPKPGVSLALDFPQSENLGKYLFPRLDAIVREAGGRLYPAKDAHMSGEDFRLGYPAWSRVEALRDPALLSRFWARVLQ